MKNILFSLLAVLGFVSAVYADDIKESSQEETTPVCLACSKCDKPNSMIPTEKFSDEEQK